MSGDDISPFAQVVRGPQAPCPGCGHERPPAAEERPCPECRTLPIPAYAFVIVRTPGARETSAGRAPSMPRGAWRVPIVGFFVAVLLLLVAAWWFPEVPRGPISLLAGAVAAMSCLPLLAEHLATSQPRIPRSTWTLAPAGVTSRSGFLPWRRIRGTHVRRARWYHGPRAPESFLLFASQRWLGGLPIATDLREADARELHGQVESWRAAPTARRVPSPWVAPLRCDRCGAPIAFAPSTLQAEQSCPCCGMDRSTLLAALAVGRTRPISAFQLSAPLALLAATPLAPIAGAFVDASRAGRRPMEEPGFRLALVAVATSVAAAAVVGLLAAPLLPRFLDRAWISTDTELVVGEKGIRRVVPWTSIREIRVARRRGAWRLVVAALDDGSEETIWLHAKDAHRVSAWPSSVSAWRPRASRSPAESRRSPPTRPPTS
jgi:hypothetical protein